MELSTGPSRPPNEKNVPLGRLLATPGILREVPHDEMLQAVSRHQLGLFVQARRAETLRAAHLKRVQVSSIPTAETPFEPPPRRRAFQEGRVSK